MWALSCFLLLSCCPLSLLTCPLCPHHVSSKPFTLVPCSLPRLWILASPLTGRKPTPASKIAPVLASEQSFNKRVVWQPHAQKKGEGGDGQMALSSSETTSYHRDCSSGLPTCFRGRRRRKKTFQMPQRNETAGLNCNLKTVTLWTAGSWKQWFGTFGLRTVCFFFPPFHRIINNNISLGECGWCATPLCCKTTTDLAIICIS